MRSRTRKRLMIGVGLAISAVAVLYLLHGLRGAWGELWEAFKAANYLYVVPAVALIGVVYGLRIVRWKLLLKPTADVPYSAVASATCIGFMSSCVLPLRPGEVIRPYVVHRKSGVAFGDAAGTALGLERVFDLIGVCFMLLLTALLMSRGPRAEEWMTELARKGRLLAGVTVVGMGGLALLAFFPETMLRVMGFFLRVLPAGWREPLMDFATAATRSMRFLKNPGQVAVAVGLSFLIWTVFPVSTYVLAFAFGLDLTFLGALVVQVGVTVAVAVPQAPGFIGPFQAASMKAAALFGVAKGPAGALAMMLWIIHVVPITIVGLLYLRAEGMNLLRLAEASREAVSRTEGGQRTEGPEE